MTPVQKPGLLVKFGALVQRLANLLAPSLEDPKRSGSFGTDAEARAQYTSPEVMGRTLARWAYEKLTVESGRAAAYRDYDLMDMEFPEISAALDVIAEFASQADDARAETFHIESEDQELADYLNTRVKELRLDHLITPTLRDVAKYGGTFMELIADEATGEIVRLKPLDSHTIVRNEDPYGRLMDEAFMQYDTKEGAKVASFQQWQVWHFRYCKSHSRLYGNAILEPCRKIFKQLSLMEDGLVIGRLYRSHVRYAFYIPCDGMTRSDQEDYIDKLMNKFKKKQRYDSQTGQLQTFESPMTAEQDFWLPSKVGNSAKVETIQAQGNLSEIGDIEYFQSKIFAALKVPKALIGFERDVNAKATLTTQDVNFARTLRRIQQVGAEGVREILKRVMILEGREAVEDKEWEVVFPPVSTVDELLQWQTELLKAQVAEIYKLELNVIDNEYIYKKFLDLTDDEITEMTDRIEQDKIDNPPVVAAPGAAPVVPGKGVAPLPPKTPTQPKLAAAPSPSERAAVRRIRALFEHNQEGAILESEVTLAHLIAKTRESVHALLGSNGDSGE